MSPYKAPAKPVTPESVKIFMILEALVLGFLSFWMIDEYMNNIFMQQYVNTVFSAHITTYTMMIGLGIGLGGTVVAALFYRRLGDEKDRLVRMPAPRLKATVKQALSVIPLIDEETALADTERIMPSDDVDATLSMETITTQPATPQASSSVSVVQTGQPTSVPSEQDQPPPIGTSHKKKNPKHPDQPP